MKRPRIPRAVRWAAIGVVVLVVAGVWVSHQFPALTNGPKSSAEILHTLLSAPARRAEDVSQVLLWEAKQKGIEAFLLSSDLPADVEGRLLALVRGEGFRHVTVPFVYYLYDMYGSAADPGAGPEDLAYAEEDVPRPAARGGGPGLSDLVRNSRKYKKHVTTALCFFDALFLQVKPDAVEQGLPLHQRYDEAAYRNIQELVRRTASEYLGPAQDATQQPPGPKSYETMLQEIVADDERLGALVEFLTDAIRQQSDGWLESFLMRRHRQEVRLAWAEECIRKNRLYEIADYARGRAQRRLAVQIVVDGLQGKLLEGLAQLSSGDRGGSGAAYVAELVRIHQSKAMDPATHGSKMPPPLGNDVLELVERAPIRPDYLENFKRHVFGPEAQAVVVNVATVETPTISVRNLQVVKSGHTVAGPFGTGIPNFSYLDRRTEQGWYFWGSDAVHIGRIFANREDEIPHARRREGPGARTLFQRLAPYNTLSSMASIDAGALEKIAGEVGLAVGEFNRNFMEKLLVIRLRRRAAVENELNRRRRWLYEHRSLSQSVLGSLVFKAADVKTFHDHARFIAEHEDEGLPDFLLWYNPWPDHFAHPKGPFSDAILGYQGEYDRLDFYLGKVVEVYESVESADGQSTYADRTLFGLVSDHGMVYSPQTVSTEKLLLKAIQEAGVQVKYLKLTADEGELPVIRNRSRPLPTRPYDVVVGSTAGGSYVIDVFSLEGLKGDQEAWRRHPDYHEVRRHRLLSGQTIDWKAELDKRLNDVMDIAVVREYGPGPDTRWPDEVESAVRVAAPGGREARIVRIRKPASAAPAVRYRYEILGERDPLDLVGSVREYLLPQGGPSLKEAQAAVRACLGSPEGCPDERWQEVLSYTLRPDAVYQLSHLYDTDRAGTINVFPARHVAVNSEVPGRHAGEMFEEKNGTQVYFGAGLRRGRLQTARNGCLAVTLYHWLAGDASYRAGDQETGTPASEQFGYPSLLGNAAFGPIR